MEFIIDMTSKIKKEIDMQNIKGSQNGILKKGTKIDKENQNCTTKFLL